TDEKADFVRALRRISSERESPKLEQLLGFLVARVPLDNSSDMTETERVGLDTHNPPWWVSYCFYHFGRETGLKILSPPARPRYVRVNSLRNRGRIGLPLELRKYSGQLVEADSGTHLLTGSPSVLAKYFERGLFQVQDFASYLSVKAADPTPGENVLDLCAAPGGKTATLAQMMKNRGRITSVDYSRTRMASWRTETGRLGVKIASPLIGDASNLGLAQQFDLVIVDASILIGIELQVISSLDSNVLLRHNASPRFEIRRVEESSLIGRLGAVESASPHEVRDYWHQVKSAYPSKVSPSC